MGCSSSSSAADGPAEHASSSSVMRDMSRVSQASSASALSGEKSKVAHRRLRKLRELDEATMIPFILVELRGIAHGHGFVEICGKDEYGVYSALHSWLTSTWGCKKLDAGDLKDNTPVPFCDALYEWNDYKCHGDEGMSNMGLATMRLVDFMANTLTWTLGVINGGNVGSKGEIREQQVIFKAPHPMNLVASHVMVELRSAGYVEVCHDVDSQGLGAGVLDDIHKFLTQEFRAKELKGHEAYCDRYYQTGRGVFKERGTQGENNIGLITTQVCDYIVRLPGWNLVTMNGGNYGESGTHREQQLVFRWDNHPLQEQPHMLVEMRDAGFVEVNGANVDNIYKDLNTWLQSTWKCTEVRALAGQEAFCNKKYKWPVADTTDMMAASANIIEFFHSKGWQMQVCSQGTVKTAGKDDSREQQILFRPGMSSVGVVEPHLIVELFMGEGKEELYQSGKTQVLGNQHVRMCPIGDCSDAVEKFHGFMVEYLGGRPSDDRYFIDVCLSRGYTDNNLGAWTMRICDFMVDRLGWSFVVCNVCNLGELGHLREQQLVFRKDGPRREIPVSKDLPMFKVPESAFAKLKLPSFWKIPEVLSRKKYQAVIRCEQEEVEALQEIMDKTFRRVLTRDRVYEFQISTSEEMPYRVEIVTAFRSENLPLYKRYSERHAKYKGGTPVRAKTSEGGAAVNTRLQDGESLLFHGTNPSSAISILKTGFVLNNAGKSTGTMFGYGVYLAECSSKSDEYAADDSGGTFPQLRAILVCRCLVGNPYVVHKAGDHIEEAKKSGCDCVMGDRESVVNTYREFVFFDESQILPEYTIIYKRQYDKAKVPASLQTHATGTTGRCWQVKMDKGWVSVPVNVNHELVTAIKAGKAKLDVTIGEFEYTFDFKAKQQTNKSTGKTRELRPPMVS